MTEQEAEVLAARLTKVWQIQLSPHAPTWNFGDICFSFDRYVVEGICLSFRIYDDGPMVELEPEEAEIELLCRHGEVAPYWTCSEGDMPEENILDPFADKWLSFFRRGCWLSGCDIEASAHEKAELMQGFTKEEVEAWNLKM